MSWFENKHPITKKAPKHQMVSVKRDMNNTQRTAFAPEKDDLGEFTEFSFTVPKNKISAMRDFAEDSGYEIKIQGDGICNCVIFDKHMPVFIKFLRENDIDVEDAPSLDDEKFADEIVEEVQEGRKESSKSRDRNIKASKVGEKDDAESLVSWIRHPNKSDLRGED